MGQRNESIEDYNKGRIPRAAKPISMKERLRLRKEYTEYRLSKDRLANEAREKSRQLWESGIPETKEGAHYTYNHKCFYAVTGWYYYPDIDQSKLINGTVDVGDGIRLYPNGRIIVVGDSASVSEREDYYKYMKIREDILNRFPISRFPKREKAKAGAWKEKLNEKTN